MWTADKMWMPIIWKRVLIFHLPLKGRGFALLDHCYKPHLILCIWNYIYLLKHKKSYFWKNGSWGSPHCLYRWNSPAPSSCQKEVPQSTAGRRRRTSSRGSVNGGLVGGTHPSFTTQRRKMVEPWGFPLTHLYCHHLLWLCQSCPSGALIVLYHLPCQLCVHVCIYLCISVGSCLVAQGQWFWFFVLAARLILTTRTTSSP